jgi:uncharacterized membrane protein YsdA (DUF1294 family)
MTAALLSAAVTYLLAINLVTFVGFATDKHRARRNGRRTPERSLLILAAAGGAPAALLAQQTLRHKTRKQPFGTRLIVIAGLQVATLVGMAVVLRP